MVDTDPNLPTSETTFVRLLAKHEPEIRAYIRASIPSSHDVAEVMQNVSIVAWRKFPELDKAEANFAKWTCVIARFEILKYRRGLSRDRFVLKEDLVEQICMEGEAESALREQQIHYLESCLSELPEERRKFVVQAYSPGTTIKQLATQSGKNPDAIYQLMRRIRQKLGDCIQLRLQKMEGKTT